MEYAKLKDILAKDRQRYGKIGRIRYYMDPLAKMIRRYRWCKYLQTHIFFQPAYLLMRLLYQRSCRQCGCDIPSKVDIGEGFKIEHGWGIVINSNCRIGNNVTMLSGCVLGANPKGTPTIGDNVTLGAHAIIIGNVHVGNNAWIGAGAIVTHDVPEYGVVYGEASETRRIRCEG